MNGEQALTNKKFLEKFTIQNDTIYEELKSRLDATVLKVMKNYLKEKHIEFDGTCIDLDEFKRVEVKKLSKMEQLALAKIEKDLHKELSDMTKALHDGSETAFSAVVGKLGEFGKSALKMTARMSAMQVAYALNPTFGGAILATSIAVPSVVKGIKNFKTREEETKSASIDAVLLRISTVEDKESGKKKLELDNGVMTRIQEMMQREGVFLDSSSTVKFIRDIAGLDIEHKERIVRKINSEYGYSQEDYDKQINSLKTKIENVKKVMKEDVVAPLSTAAMVGLNIGNSLATWNPEVSASVVTALGTGIMTGDMATAAIAGVSQYGASTALQTLPLPEIVSDTIQGFNELETMAGATGLVLTGSLLLKVVPTLAKHGFLAARNFIKTKIDDSKNKKLLDSQEKEELGKKIEESLELTARNIEGKSAREISLGIIADVLRAKGIELGTNIVTKEELKKFTQSLSVEDKKDIMEVTKALEKAEELEGNQIKQALSGLAKCAYWGGVIALAGLGTYDAFINPGFIEGLVARQAYGIDMEATLDEQLTSLKEGITELPEQMEIMQENVSQAIKNPQDFINDKIELKQNARVMIREQEEFLKAAGRKFPEFQNPQEAMAWRKEQIRLANEARHAQAVADYEEAVNAFVGDLSATATDKVMMSEVNVKIPFIPNTDISASTNDLVIRTLNLDTEEGVVNLFKEIGTNYESVQKLMEREGASTLEELAKCENVKSALEKLGDVDYFGAPLVEKKAEWQFWKKGYIERDYSKEMVNIINHRTDRVLKFMPVKGANTEEVSAFLEWMCDSKGQIDEEKLKYYTLFQEKAQLADNDGTWEAVRRVLTNLEVDPNSDELPNQIGTALKTTITEQSEANRKAIRELFMKHKEAIARTEEVMDIVKNTEKGFTDGLNSRISSNPINVMEAGAVAGAGIGIVKEVKNGLFGKMGRLIKRIFGKKAKALSPAEEIGTIHQGNDMRKNIKFDVKGGAGELDPKGVGQKKEGNIR